MKTSKFGICIREDNKEIRAFQSAFDRKIGDILTINNRKFKVVSLEQNFYYAQGHIGLFTNMLFSFYKY